MAQTNDQGATFWEWLLAQKGDGAIADLVPAVKADKLFLGWHNIIPIMPEYMLRDTVSAK